MLVAALILSVVANAETGKKPADKDPNDKEVQCLRALGKFQNRDNKRKPSSKKEKWARQAIASNDGKFVFDGNNIRKVTDPKQIGSVPGDPGDKREKLGTKPDKKNEVWKEGDYDKDGKKKKSNQKPSPNQQAAPRKVLQDFIADDLNQAKREWSRVPNTMRDDIKKSCKDVTDVKIAGKKASDVVKGLKDGTNSTASNSTAGQSSGYTLKLIDGRTMYLPAPAPGGGYYYPGLARRVAQ